MQNLTPLLLTSAILAGTASAAAQTQPAPPPAASPATTVPQTAPGAVAPNFDELISSLNNMRAEIANVQAMNGGSANNIRPVNVAQLQGSNPSALSSAMSKNQAQLNALRSALSRVTVTTATNEHITLAQFLSDNKISTTQVVGADMNNGVLVLFYRKP